MFLTYVPVLVVLVVAAVVVSSEEPAVRQNRTKREVAERKSLTVEERQTVVNKHNELRKAVTPSASNMKHMTWDAELEKMAQQWADRCSFEHGNPFKHSTFSATGQNLYVNTASPEISQPVQSWYDEVKDYNYQSNSCNSNQVCGHYTQVVWAKSDKLGCGIRQCSSVKKFGDRAGYIVVCNYGPAGNYAGETPYNTGSGCGACPTGYSCQGGLCKKSDSCSSKCENGAEINDDCICQCAADNTGPLCGAGSMPTFGLLSLSVALVTTLLLTTR